MTYWRILCLPVAAVLLWSCVPQKAATSPDVKKKLDTHYQMGITYIAEGKTPQAIKELMAAQALAPDNAAVEHALGLAYQQKGLYDQAIFQYQKAITLDPKLTEARNNMGTAYLAKGNYKQALAEFEMCLKDPAYGTPEKALYNMGFASLKMKKVDKAIEYYEKSLAMGPENVNTLYYLARAYLEKKENAKALAQLKKVVATDPKFHDAEYQLGLLYEEQKNYPLALGAFRRAVKVDSSNIDAQLHLGLCLVNLGEKDEGAKNLEIVARIDPQGATGKQAAEELAKVKTDHKFRGIPKVSVR